MDPTSRPSAETRRWLEQSILKELSKPDRAPLSNCSQTLYRIYSSEVTRCSIDDGSREFKYFMAFSYWVRHAAVKQALQQLRRRGLIRKERQVTQVFNQGTSAESYWRDWVWWPTGLLERLAVAAVEPPHLTASPRRRRRTQRG